MNSNKERGDIFYFRNLPALPSSSPLVTCGRMIIVSNMTTIMLINERLPITRGEWDDNADLRTRWWKEWLCVGGDFVILVAPGDSVRHGGDSWRWLFVIILLIVINLLLLSIEDLPMGNWSFVVTLRWSWCETIILVMDAFCWSRGLAWIFEILDLLPFAVNITADDWWFISSWRCSISKEWAFLIFSKLTRSLPLRWLVSFEVCLFLNYYSFVLEPRLRDSRFVFVWSLVRIHISALDTHLMTRSFSDLKNTKTNEVSQIESIIWKSNRYWDLIVDWLKLAVDSSKDEWMNEIRKERCLETTKLIPLFRLTFAVGSTWVLLWEPFNKWKLEQI